MAGDAQHLAERSLLAKCVHCGFCLPTCPTYLLGGEEMDSPRGRIYLLAAGLEGRVPFSERFVKHFDSCLGCLACVTACPSGVEYGPLIETARVLVEERHRRELGDRLFRRALFAVLPYPRRLRVLASPLRLYPLVEPVLRRSGWLRRSASRLAALARLAPAIAAVGSHGRRTEPPPPPARPRLRVGILPGCVQQVFFAHVNDATVKVLTAEGVQVVEPSGLDCCGALPLHAGQEAQARGFARRTIAAFEALDVDRIAVNAAGCGSAMKTYGRLLAADPAWSARADAFAHKVRDISEILDELGPPRSARHPLPMRLAYHDACHLAHAQGVRRQPRDLLRGIPGVELVPLAESEICCGSAGIYNLIETETAAALGTRKVGQIAGAAPDAVATANPGCLIQIAATASAAGHTWPVFHPIELLAASIDGRDVRRVLGRDASPDTAPDGRAAPAPRTLA